jgi:hypothetical protein
VLEAGRAADVGGWRARREAWAPRPDGGATGQRAGAVGSSDRQRPHGGKLGRRGQTVALQVIGRVRLEAWTDGGRAQSAGGVLPRAGQEPRLALRPQQPRRGRRRQVSQSAKQAPRDVAAPAGHVRAPAVRSSPPPPAVGV